MKTKNIFLTIIAALMMFSFSACQKDELDPGGTAVQSMAGEWFVQSDNGSGGNIGGSYYKFSTYNTSLNTGTSMFIDDNENYWTFKGKVTVDLAAKTFKVTGAQNEYYDMTFTVTDGKIVTGGTTGPASGAVTDAISFSVEFSDDPGTIYKFKGYRRTKFAEDEH